MSQHLRLASSNSNALPSPTPHSSAKFKMLRANWSEQPPVPALMLKVARLKRECPDEARILEGIVDRLLSNQTTLCLLVAVALV